MVNNHGTIITVAVPSIQHQPDGGDSSPGHTAATVVGRGRTYGCDCGQSGSLYGGDRGRPGLMGATVGPVQEP